MRIAAGLVMAFLIAGCTVSIPFGSEECDSPSGSPTDLASQPDDWLDYGTYLRWTDSEGCLVRIDVISHHHGAEHCGWEQSQYITIGKPLGRSMQDNSEEETARYFWDPQGVLPGGPFGTEIERANLPGSAVDTGFRRNGHELWLDESDESVIYIVAGDTVQVWEETNSAACA